LIQHPCVVLKEENNPVARRPEGGAPDVLARFKLQGRRASRTRRENAPVSVPLSKEAHSAATCLVTRSKEASPERHPPGTHRCAAEKSIHGELL